MRPCVCAVLCDEDRHVAEDFDAFLFRIVMQTIPLEMEDVLLEAIQFHLIPLPLGKCLERRRVAMLDLVRPLCPRFACVFFLCRMEERIVIEPIRFSLAECLELLILCARLAEHAKCFFEQIFFELLDALKVDERRVRLVWQEEILLCQPAARGKILGVNHHDIARKGGDGLIGRVAMSNGTERQNLPDLLPRLGEEVEEAICLLAKVAHAVF